MLIYFQIKLYQIGRYAFFAEVFCLFLLLQQFAHILAVALIILYYDYWLNKCVKLFVQSPRLEVNSARPETVFVVCAHVHVHNIQYHTWDKGRFITCFF